MHRGERAKGHLTQAQVSAIIWTIFLTWLRTKNGGCVSHDVKKNLQNTKQQKNQCKGYNAIVLYLK